MSDNAEPVEISTRMRQGEWTQDSLIQLTASYQQKLQDMGAALDEIKTTLEETEDGSVFVRVSWEHQDSDTRSDLGQSTVAEAENSRGHGEYIPPGEPTQDSQGLGAVLGDANRSAIDEPPAAGSEKDAALARKQADQDFDIRTDSEGHNYAEDS